LKVFIDDTFSPPKQQQKVNYLHKYFVDPKTKRPHPVIKEEENILLFGSCLTLPLFIEKKRLLALKMLWKR